MATVLEHVLPGDLFNTGMILFVDNYYTSIHLAVTLLAFYGIYLVGTYSPRKGAASTEMSFPFRKITSTDAACVSRGWMRRVVQTFTAGAKRVEVQSIIWKDTKVVGFISTAYVGAASVTADVFRSTKGMFKTLKVKAHDAIIAYLSYYGAVDRADRGIADFSISVKTNRWYMRVAFWVLDVVLWNIWVIVTFRVDSGLERDQFYERFNGKGGTVKRRWAFQMELADQLIRYSLEGAIAAAGGDRTRVKWAHQPGGGRFTAATSPSDRVGSGEAKHAKGDLKPGADRHCQYCYNHKTNKELRVSVRKTQSKRARFFCQACSGGKGWRFCETCFVEHHHSKKLDYE